MSRRDPMVAMCHMLEYARVSVEMCEGRARGDLDADRMFRLALTRAVEVIGEAAARIPAETRDHYPQIPWREVVGIRHRLIHGCDQVDLDLLWEAATHSARDLIVESERIIPPELLEGG